MVVNGEFKGWTKASIQNITGDVSEIKEMLIDHIVIDGKRISKLENWRSWMMGGLAILSIAIIVIGTVFGR